MKRKAPQKKCPSCDTFAHARTSTCKKCKHVFYVKKSVQATMLAKNWQDLKAGDVIKCVAGHGPYFLSKDRPGERIMMGHRGKFEILEIVDEGPQCRGMWASEVFPRGLKSNYREFIYMGEAHHREDVNIHYRPHKIKVIKKT